MSDFYNNDDIVSSVDQSKADIIDRLDELEKKINKIYEIVENLEAKLY
jgi:peptidoglycan hydrolase CwlO-like protein